MSSPGIVSPTVARLLLFFFLYLVLAIMAAVIIERSISAALKSLKLALKFEFTTDAGRLNLVSMILFVILIFTFNLHEMFTEMLSVQGTDRTDHVIAPTIMVGLFFLGSLVCVMLLEKKK
jgi:hypothetical protein